MRTHNVGQIIRGAFVLAGCLDLRSRVWGLKFGRLRWMPPGEYHDVYVRIGPMYALLIRWGDER